MLSSSKDTLLDFVHLHLQPFLHPNRIRVYLISVMRDITDVMVFVISQTVNAQETFIILTVVLQMTLRVDAAGRVLL